MTALTIIFYSLLILIGLIILYYLIKAAVRNGIREAFSENDDSALSKKMKLVEPANFAQTRLQQQYNSGEITFEEFKSQWDKLKS